jgi:hypothetical protein
VLFLADALRNVLWACRGGELGVCPASVSVPVVRATSVSSIALSILTRPASYEHKSGDLRLTARLRYAELVPMCATSVGVTGRTWSRS